MASTFGGLMLRLGILDPKLTELEGVIANR
jgi:hypothetical protein